MSDEILLFPAEDIADSVAAAMKAVLVDLPEFRKTLPGFTATLAAGDTSFDFPNVGVDFRTVVPSGLTGNWHPEVLMPEGIVARVRTDSPQPGGIVTIPDYTGYTTFFVGMLDDLPFDLFTYLGDPLGAQKQLRTIPIGIPVVDLFRVVQMAGRGQTAVVQGYFCIYGGADQGGRAIVKAETGKLYRKLYKALHIFGTQGITNLIVKPPVYSNYSKNAAITEGAIQFSCMIRVA